MNEPFRLAFIPSPILIRSAAAACAQGGARRHEYFQRDEQRLRGVLWR